jgi:hypothetical protein
MTAMMIFRRTTFLTTAYYIRFKDVSAVTLY